MRGRFGGARLVRNPEARPRSRKTPKVKRSIRITRTFQCWDDGLIAASVRCLTSTDPGPHSYFYGVPKQLSQAMPNGQRGQYRGIYALRILDNLIHVRIQGPRRSLEVGDREEMDETLDTVQDGATLRSP